MFTEINMKYSKLLLGLFFLFKIQISHAQIEIDARYVILQDYLSGKIIYEKDADEKIYPASMTKIMTSIVAFDLIKSGEASLDELITISEKVATLWLSIFV